MKKQPKKVKRTRAQHPLAKQPNQRRPEGNETELLDRSGDNCPECGFETDESGWCETCDEQTN